MITGQSLLVLGVDPGVLTGLMLARFMSDGTAQLLQSGECAFMDAVEWVRRGVASAPAGECALVAEKFIITHRTATLNAPGASLEMIGAVRVIAHDSGNTLSLQAPSEAKSLVSNQMLRDAGLWVRGSKGHCLDAGRHAVLYAVRAGWRPVHAQASEG